MFEIHGHLIHLLTAAILILFQILLLEVRGERESAQLNKDSTGDLVFAQFSMCSKRGKKMMLSCEERI